MASSEARRGPLRGQALLNLVMRAVLATPVLHRAVSGRVLVLDIVGRKSGRTYRIPVGYVPSKDGLLIGTAGRWRHNLTPGQSVHVTVGRTSREMIADVVTDEERCAMLDREILAGNPVHGKFADIRTEPDGTPNPDDLRAALARGMAVVRLLEPDEWAAQPVE